MPLCPLSSCHDCEVSHVRRLDDLAGIASERVPAPAPWPRIAAFNGEAFPQYCYILWAGTGREPNMLSLPLDICRAWPRIARTPGAKRPRHGLGGESAALARIFFLNVTAPTEN